MNTMPDEELLALWVEDELQGTDAATVEAWAATQPEWLEHRDQARQMKSLLRAHLPAAVEPPYADFFNSRISREIAREAAGAAPVTGPSAAAAAVRSGFSSFWRFFLPTTAVAGMALCFWAGTRAGNRVIPGPSVGQSGPVLYTPE
ncbi:hypothetical protein, partial [Haloferula sp. BvORR071]|uniref:anti-sigma factor family protein n=1 Tax=Haloferula sp. BvORR071 TaxID=1396141 RepID=UPI002240EFED